MAAEPTDAYIAWNQLRDEINQSRVLYRDFASPGSYAELIELISDSNVLWLFLEKIRHYKTPATSTEKTAAFRKSQGAEENSSGEEMLSEPLSPEESLQREVSVMTLVFEDQMKLVLENLVSRLEKDKQYFDLTALPTITRGLAVTKEILKTASIVKEAEEISALQQRCEALIKIFAHKTTIENFIGVSYNSSSFSPCNSAIKALNEVSPEDFQKLIKENQNKDRIVQAVQWVFQYPLSAVSSLYEVTYYLQQLQVLEERVGGGCYIQKAFFLEGYINSLEAYIGTPLAHYEIDAIQKFLELSRLIISREQGEGSPLLGRCDQLIADYGHRLEMLPPSEEVFEAFIKALNDGASFLTLKQATKKLNELPADAEFKEIIKKDGNKEKICQALQNISSHIGKHSFSEEVFSKSKEEEDNFFGTSLDCSSWYEAIRFFEEVEKLKSNVNLLTPSSQKLSSFLGGREVFFKKMLVFLQQALLKSDASPASSTWSFSSLSSIFSKTEDAQKQLQQYGEQIGYLKKFPTIISSEDLVPLIEALNQRMSSMNGGLPTSVSLEGPFLLLPEEGPGKKDSGIVSSVSNFFNIGFLQECLRISGEELKKFQILPESERKEAVLIPTQKRLESKFLESLLSYPEGAEKRGIIAERNQLLREIRETKGASCAAVLQEDPLPPPPSSSSPSLLSPSTPSGKRNKRNKRKGNQGTGTLRRAHIASIATDPASLNKEELLARAQNFLDKIQTSFPECQSSPSTSGSEGLSLGSIRDLIREGNSLINSYSPQGTIPKSSRKRVEGKKQEIETAISKFSKPAYLREITKDIYPQLENILRTLEQELLKVSEDLEGLGERKERINALLKEGKSLLKALEIKFESSELEELGRIRNDLSTLLSAKNTSLEASTSSFEGFLQEGMQGLSKSASQIFSTSTASPASSERRTQDGDSLVIPIISTQREIQKKAIKALRENLKNATTNIAKFKFKPDTKNSEIPLPALMRFIRAVNSLYNTHWCDRKKSLDEEHRDPTTVPYMQPPLWKDLVSFYGGEKGLISLREGLLNKMVAHLVAITPKHLTQENIEFFFGTIHEYWHAMILPADLSTFTTLHEQNQRFFSEFQETKRQCIQRFIRSRYEAFFTKQDICANDIKSFANEMAWGSDQLSIPEKQAAARSGTLTPIPQKDEAQQSAIPTMALTVLGNVPNGEDSHVVRQWESLRASLVTQFISQKSAQLDRIEREQGSRNAFFRDERVTDYGSHLLTAQTVKTQTQQLLGEQFLTPRVLEIRALYERATGVEGNLQKTNSVQSEGYNFLGFWSNGTSSRNSEETWSLFSSCPSSSPSPSSSSSTTTSSCSIGFAEVGGGIAMAGIIGCGIALALMTAGGPITLVSLALAAFIILGLISLISLFYKRCDQESKATPNTCSPCI